MGYDGMFKAKSDSPCRKVAQEINEMHPENERIELPSDGVAIFWLQKKYKLVEARTYGSDVKPGAVKCRSFFVCVCVCFFVCLFFFLFRFLHRKRKKMYCLFVCLYVLFCFVARGCLCNVITYANKR